MKLREANWQLEQYEESAAPLGWVCSWDRYGKIFFEELWPLNAHGPLNFWVYIWQKLESLSVSYTQSQVNFSCTSKFQNQESKTEKGNWETMVHAGM